MTAPVRQVATTRIGAFAEIDFQRLIDEQTPMVFKGLAADLPLVRAGLVSDEAAMQHLLPYYGGKPLLVFKGEPPIRGRFGYTPEVDDFNFTSEHMTLDCLFDLLRAHRDDAEAPSFYCGSTDIDTFLPGLLAGDGLPLSGEMFTRNAVLKSIWIGNRTTACAHFDISHNIAVCMAGRHRLPRTAAARAAHLHHAIELETVRHGFVDDRAIARADGIGLRTPGCDQQGLLRIGGQPGGDGLLPVGRQFAVDIGVQLVLGYG